MNDELIEQMPAVYRFVLRLARGNVHQAEELLQETMLRAVRNTGQVHDGSKLRSWLFAIAANVARDLARKASNQSQKPACLNQANQVEEIQNADPLPIEKLVADEMWETALAALDRLPDRQRSVLYLHACEHHDLAEIAMVLGITKQAAKASLSMARARLARIVGVENES